jgi:hypothetical protein
VGVGMNALVSEKDRVSVLYDKRVVADKRAIEDPLWTGLQQSLSPPCLPPSPCPPLLPSLSDLKMNLDDMLNEVDLSTLPGETSKQSTSAATNETTKKSNESTTAKNNDLDAILDEAITSNNIAGKSDADVDVGLKMRIVSDDIKPWLAASANVPKDYREKWTKMAKIDIEAEFTTKFQLSYAYRSWDGPVPVKNGINRSLQETVRRAAALSGLDEAKASRLLNIVNPVTDSENGKQLQAAYAKQLLEDFAGAIKQDSNFSPNQFPSLAEAIPNN